MGTGGHSQIERQGFWNGDAAGSCAAPLGELNGTAAVAVVLSDKGERVELVEVIDDSVRFRATPRQVSDGRAIDAQGRVTALPWVGRHAHENQFSAPASPGMS